MSLTSGTRLGQHEILAPLGKGGMGEVYRARDTKLGREVAIKVLPAELASDPERMGRFEREARVLASLNHPNVATLHGFETEGDTSYLVMELVEGETLADRIARGKLPADEAIPLFLQIAEGLEAAHDKGVIHRDLKPANVVITPDGRVKVLDFGLAKAMAPDTDPSGNPDLSASPTMTMGATQMGMVLGTAAYMSPEQARGLPVDQRADIWAFGACLFEALAGKKVFEGEDASTILASVIKSDPKWEHLPAETSRKLREFLHRCLQKNPRNRLHHIADARIELEEIQAGGEGEEKETAATPSRRTSLLLPVIAALLAAAVAFMAGRWTTPSPELVLQKFELEATPTMINSDPLSGPVISPDGRKVVLVHEDGLRIRDLEGLEVRALPGTESAERPFWSPESDWLGYFVDASVTAASLYKVPVAGGPPTSLGRLPVGSVHGAMWTPEDEIVVASTVEFDLPKAELFSIDAGGGPFSSYETQADGAPGVLFPALLPDGKTYLAVEVTESGEWKIVVNGPKGRTELIEHPGESLAYPVYSPPGYILYQRGLETQYTSGERAGLWAFRFDLSGNERQGEPFLVSRQGSHPSFSKDGTLIYQITEGQAMEQLARVDRSGSVLGLIGEPHEWIDNLEISPDGRQIVFMAMDSLNSDIFITDEAEDVETRLTFDPSLDLDPTWSPDGTRIAFASTRSVPGDIYAQSATGRGSIELLTGGPQQQNGPEWEPDGNGLVFNAFDPKLDWSLMRLRPGGEPEVLQPRSGHAKISPTGRHVMYMQWNEGEFSNGWVTLSDYPDLEQQWQVSEGAGVGHRWSRGSDEIFYVDPETNSLMAVPVRTEPSVQFGRPEALFAGGEIPARLSAADFRPAYDGAPDGQSFVVVRKLGQRLTVPVLVENWWVEFEED